MHSTPQIQRDINTIFKKYKKEEWLPEVVKYIDQNYSWRHEILRKPPMTAARKLTTELLNPGPIIDRVCEFFNTDIESISTKSRVRENVYVRQVCMYCLMKFTRLSQKNIGRIFGGRDHTTAIHAVKTLQDRIDTDTIIRQEVEHIITLITSSGPLPYDSLHQTQKTA